MSISEGKCIYALKTILTNNNGDVKGIELIYNYLTEQLTKEINDYRIEQTKNNEGIIPIMVEKKKLKIFTLNIQGKTFDKANGIPPTNR